MKLAILALCSLGLAVPALGLKCYECKSNGSDKCSDPFSPTGIRTTQCGPSLDSSEFWDNMAHVFPGIRPPPNSLSTRGSSISTPVCLKFVFSAINGQQQTWRSCSLFGSSPCSSMTGVLEGVNGKVHACETCKDDLCNSAPRDLLAVSTALVSTLMLALRSF